MTAIERICELLKSDGYAPTLAAVEGKDTSVSPLVVPFRPDPVGRELALFIEVMPRDGDDEVSFISFSLIYPFELLETQPDRIGELARALFLLNRFLPVGNHAFCEQTPAVYFTYQLAVEDALHVPPAVITETVNMIGYFTRRHGQYVGRVLAGEVHCDELLDELEAAGMSLPPLFARSVADSESAAIG